MVLTDGYVPGPLIVAARSIRHEDRHGCGQKIWWTGKSEGGRGVVSKRADHSGQEALKADGGDVRVVHQAEHPSAPIS